MKKRVLAVLLALMMVLPLLPTAALAAKATSGTCGDNVKWSLDNGVLTISGTGAMTNDASSSSAPWHSQSSSIKTVVIGEGITSITGYAFYYHRNLTSVSIPYSVTSIGGLAFYGCSRLTSVTIPSGVTSIGVGSFAGCTSLTNVTIPDSVTSIGSSAFSRCTGLTSVTIGSGITSIEDEVFQGCSSLTYVAIPSSVLSIGTEAFRDCTGLTDVSIPSGIISIGSKSFVNCKKLTSVTIPSSVTSIGGHAFDGCASLSSITIPKNVANIGGGAFANCSRLDSIQVESGNQAYTSADGVLFWSPGNGIKWLHTYPGGKPGKYTIPNNGVTQIYVGSSAFCGCVGLSNLTIPEYVTRIDAPGISGCTYLTDVYYGGSEAQWKKIASNFGDFRRNLSNVTIHYNSTGPTDQPTTPTTSNVFDIKDGVLVKYKGNGGDITIPDGVTSIADGSFHNCIGLTSVTIPDGVTKIGAHAFQNCRNLTNITIPNSVTSIGPQAFDGCKSLTNLTIPSGVTSIAYFAFPGCTSLTSVTIPDSVTSIGTMAFYGCTGLKDVYYGGSEAQWNSVNVCDENDALKNATIHYNNTGPTDQPTTPSISDEFEIKDGVLVKYKGNGGNVVIPDNVTDIGIMAFDGCTDLTSVTIPNSVTGIWGGAFYGCTGLTNVTIPNSVTDIGQNAFYGCTGLTSITIPDSVTSITYAAFTDCTGMTAIQVSARNQKYASVDGVLFSKDLKTLEAYPGGKKGAYTIPSGTASIGICAFTDTGITSVSIPSSVTSIEWGVFRGCLYLTDIYYGGSEAQWKAIKSFEVDDFRDDLLSATIHYNSTGTGPTQPATPETNTAYASTQNVLVDGKPVEFQAYALKDANGNDTNYVKLRDVAYALNGTAAQFSVGWDAANKSIAVTKGTAYAPDGTEMKTPFSGNRSYKVSASPVFLDGKQVELEAILLTDDAGNGYTYFKLGNLGEALGFAVNWSADKGIYIETK